MLVSMQNFSMNTLNIGKHNQPLIYTLKKTFLLRKKFLTIFNIHRDPENKKQTLIITYDDQAPYAVKE